MRCPKRNYKEYPGIMGIKWSGNQPDPVVNYTSLGNPSTWQTLRLVLPAIHERTIPRSHEYRPLYTWVKVVDNNPETDRDIYCGFRVMWVNGNRWTGYMSPKVHTTGSSEDAVEILEPAGYWYDITGGTYYFICEIPPIWHGNGRQSRIVSYCVTEVENR